MHGGQVALSSVGFFLWNKERFVQQMRRQGFCRRKHGSVLYWELATNVYACLSETPPPRFLAKRRYCDARCWAELDPRLLTYQTLISDSQHFRLPRTQEDNTLFPIIILIDEVSTNHGTYTPSLLAWNSQIKRGNQNNERNLPEYFQTRSMKLVRRVIKMP